MNYWLQPNVRGSSSKAGGLLKKPSSNQTKSGQPICYRTGQFYLLLTAALFLSEKNESSDEDIYAQCCMLRYLLYHLRCVDENEYVATKRLQKILSEEKGVSLS